MNAKLTNVLLSLITALLTGAFLFLWSLNATISKYEERDANRVIQFNDMRQDVNIIRYDVQQIKTKQALIDQKLDNKDYLSNQKQ